MISVRNLLTGIILGAAVSVLVRELGRYGLSVTDWSFRGAFAGEALTTGALIGALSQLFGQSRGRR